MYTYVSGEERQEEDTNSRCRQVQVLVAPRARTEDAVTLSGAEMMNSSSTIHLEGAVY